MDGSGIFEELCSWRITQVNWAKMWYLIAFLVRAMVKMGGGCQLTSDGPWEIWQEAEAALREAGIDISYWSSIQLSVVIPKTRGLIVGPPRVTTALNLRAVWNKTILIMMDIWLRRQSWPISPKCGWRRNEKCRSRFWVWHQPWSQGRIRGNSCCHPWDFASIHRSYSANNQVWDHAIVIVEYCLVRL